MAKRDPDEERLAVIAKRLMATPSKPRKESQFGKPRTKPAKSPKQGKKSSAK